MKTYTDYRKITTERFLTAINKLNEKGYFVSSYTSGFFDNKTECNSTIRFDMCVDSLTAIPDGYEVTIIGDNGEQQIELVQIFDTEAVSIDIYNNSNNVYVWATGLPDSQSNEYYQALKTCYINNIGDDPE